MSPTVTPPAPRQTLNSLQVLRGFAALAVVFYHTHLILGDPQYGGLRMFEAVAGKGWLGVNFFFVLSGFIILYAHLGDLGRPRQAPNYLWRRFARVYPIYWVMLTLYIGAAFVGIGYPDFRVTVGDFASAYLLVPIVPSPSLPLAVAWTLFYEIGFYALFAVAILHRGIGIALGIAWTAAICVASFGFDYTGFGPLNPWNIYFPVGVLTFLAFRRFDARLGMPMLLVGLLALGLLAVIGQIPNRITDMYGRPGGMVLLAFPFAAILLGATLIERGRTWRAPQILLLLGNASYVIYLVHSPVISVIAQIHHRFAFGLVPPAALFAITVIVSTAGGIVAHLLLEKPLLKLFKHPPRFGRRGADTVPATESAR